MRSGKYFESIRDEPEFQEVIDEIDVQRKEIEDAMLAGKVDIAALMAAVEPMLPPREPEAAPLPVLAVRVPPVAVTMAPAPVAPMACPAPFALSTTSSHRPNTSR